MLLSDKSIFALIKNDKLIIAPRVLKKDIEGCHIKLHLSKTVLKYKSGVGDLRDNSTFKTNKINLTSKGYELKENEFILGSTVEKVTIPNGYFGLIETYGNIARAGIQAHNTDGHIEPGFAGTITLEIKNNSNRPIKIYSEIPFIYLFIFKLTAPCLKPYKGKYQNQIEPTVYKKD